MIDRDLRRPDGLRPRSRLLFQWTSIACRVAALVAFSLGTASAQRNLVPCQKAIGSSAVLIPFCNGGDMKVAADGSLIARVVPLPVPGKYRVIAVRGTTGDTVVDRVLTYLPIRIPRRVADSVRALLVAGSLNPDLRAGYQSMDFPAFYQPVSRIVIGGDGSLWIARVTGDAANHLWTVLESHGTELGALRLPANLRVLAIQGDRFWGTAADADGLESVVRYRVH